MVAGSCMAEMPSRYSAVNLLALVLQLQFSGQHRADQAAACRPNVIHELTVKSPIEHLKI